MGSSEQDVDDAWEWCQEYEGDCQRSWFEVEQPQHEVYVDAFRIGRTEVTNTQFEKFINAGGYSDKSYWSDDGWSWKESEGITEPEYWDEQRLNQPQQPVVGVSWYEAEAFAAWAGGRLPTEAEWEYAARGSAGHIFPWGSEWDGTRCNYCDNNCTHDWKDESVDDGYRYTAPVGSYPSGASPYGALDMAGNAWEWCADWYDSDYYKSPADRNPQGPSSGECRVLRGGAFHHRAGFVRCAYRYWDYPNYRNFLWGFRVAASAVHL